MWSTLLARLHSAGHRSGRKYNTGTYETIISGQIELGRLPVREELQHRHTCSQPCRPDHTWQVADQGWAATQVHMWSTLPARPHSKVCLHVVQAHLFECNLHPRYRVLYIATTLSWKEWADNKNGYTNQGIVTNYRSYLLWDSLPHIPFFTWWRTWLTIL